MQAIYDRVDADSYVSGPSIMVTAEATSMQVPDRNEVIRHLQKAKDVLNEGAVSANKAYDDAIALFTKRRNDTQADLNALQTAKNNGDQDPKLDEYIAKATAKRGLYQQALITTQAKKFGFNLWVALVNKALDDAVDAISENRGLFTDANGTTTEYVYYSTPGYYNSFA